MTSGKLTSVKVSGFATAVIKDGTIYLTMGKPRV